LRPFTIGTNRTYARLLLLAKTRTQPITPHLILLGKGPGDNGPSFLHSG
jgi:hypothetical protein